MGSRKSWPAELADRCRAVNWEADIARNGHYKVKTHTGEVFSFSASPSDRYAQKQAERQANAKGLARREAAFALQRERDRLQRIADDRASIEQPTPITDKEDNMTNTPTSRDLGSINGIPIIAVEPAMIKTPRTQGKAVPLRDAEMILLESGKTLFRCTRPSIDADRPCHKSFQSAQGVATHGTWHGRWVAKTAEQPKTAPKSDERNPGIVTQLTRVIDFAEAIGDDLGAVADSFDNLKADLHKLVQDLPEYVVDGETRAKAEKYEQLRNQLGGLLK